MGKRRVQSRQVRQVRQVRPKNLPAPASGDQRKQREQYVRSGGMLQGYAPETVVKVGWLAAGGAVLCAVIAVALLLLLPYGWPVRGVAAVVWIVPIGFAASFILPGFQLARKDLKLEPKLVQGQLVGANEASTSIGLGMLMLKTRGGGFEQYLVEPEKLSKVPGNQVNVMLSVTPNLRHVRSVGIVGQRLMGRPDQPVPAIVKRLRILPIATPAALSAVAIVGVEAVALLPLYPDWAHALLAFGTGAVLAGAVFGASHLLQRRLISEVQALMPGGLS